MATVTISGGEALQRALREISARVDRAALVRVGFLENAKYPITGTQVAMVAALQNFGAPAARIPARPFFTNMVKEKSPKWGASLGRILAINNFDVISALDLMGQSISDQLIQSIKDTNEPALSPITLMLRKMFGNHPEEIRGRDVGEAARRVANGEQGATGTQAKPLNWTGHMQDSVNYEVVR